MEYIYLIREREFIRLNESTYKIGGTGRSPKCCLQGYPKGTEVILFINVNNGKLMEKIIIKDFKEKFEQMKQYGTEYFNGNINRMRQLIMLTILKEDSIEKKQ